jgi:hypothetical protein
MGRSTSALLASSFRTSVVALFPAGAHAAHSKTKLRGGATGAAAAACSTDSIKAANAQGVYWQGGKTVQVSRDLHLQNRERVLQHFNGKPAGLIVVQGGADINRADTDHHLLFRQESNFHYLFGIELPDCYGTIDVATGKATLTHTHTNTHSHKTCKHTNTHTLRYCYGTHHRQGDPVCPAPARGLHSVDGASSNPK